MAACIGEPISWLRLEAHHRAPDATVTAHVQECAACRACLDEIERDVVALPALPAAPAPKRRWWLWSLVPALAAAAILLLVLRPKPRDNVMAIKGVGDVTIELVRERAGVIGYDARTFAPGDRFKVVVTCAPSARLAITVDVRDGHTVDHPLAPAEIACGNRVVLPGAFSLDGKDPNKVCAHVDDQSACVTVSPE